MENLVKMFSFINQNFIDLLFTLTVSTVYLKNKSLYPLGKKVSTTPGPPLPPVALAGAAEINPTMAPTKYITRNINLK